MSCGGLTRCCSYKRTPLCGDGNETDISVLGTYNSLREFPSQGTSTFPPAGSLSFDYNFPTSPSGTTAVGGGTFPIGGGGASSVEQEIIPTSTRCSGDGLTSVVVGDGTMGSLFLDAINSFYYIVDAVFNTVRTGFIYPHRCTETPSGTDDKTFIDMLSSVWRFQNLESNTSILGTAESGDEAIVEARYTQSGGGIDSSAQLVADVEAGYLRVTEDGVGRQAELMGAQNEVSLIFSEGIATRVALVADGTSDVLTLSAPNTTTVWDTEVSDTSIKTKYEVVNNELVTIDADDTAGGSISLTNSGGTGSISVSIADLVALKSDLTMRVRELEVCDGGEVKKIAVLASEPYSP